MRFLRILETGKRILGALCCTHALPVHLLMPTLHPLHGSRTVRVLVMVLTGDGFDR
jgi:hypothetical protein